MIRLQQIVDTAKQAYGGNLDMAIPIEQVRDLIQLYAMSAGQQIHGDAGPDSPAGSRADRQVAT